MAPARYKRSRIFEQSLIKFQPMIHTTNRAAELPPMTQLIFSDAKYAGKRKQTRCEAFLWQMERVVR